MGEFEGDVGVRVKVYTCNVYRSVDRIQRIQSAKNVEMKSVYSRKSWRGVMRGVCIKRPYAFCTRYIHIRQYGLQMTRFTERHRARFARSWRGRRVWRDRDRCHNKSVT